MLETLLTVPQIHICRTTTWHTWLMRRIIIMCEWHELRLSDAKLLFNTKLNAIHQMCKNMGTPKMYNWASTRYPSQKILCKTHDQDFIQIGIIIIGRDYTSKLNSTPNSIPDPTPHIWWCKQIALRNFSDVQRIHPLQTHYENLIAYIKFKI
jgi:hypothetical protein